MAGNQLVIYGNQGASVCVKCGALNESPKYHQFIEQCERRSWKPVTEGEHLHWQCECGYTWVTNTWDQKGAS
jgi:hypothetical protein